MVKGIDLGKIAFLIGIVGSVIIGLLTGLDIITAGVAITTVLILSGIVIGFFNITGKESLAMMVAALILGTGAGVLALLPYVGGIIEAILLSLSKVVLPAGIVIALKTIYAKSA